MATLALQEGVQDYLIKGQIDARGLLRALRYAVERKRMEVALFAEKELAQVTLNSIGDAVICADISGNLTFLNPVAERMTGWSREEAAGRPVAEVFRIVDATSRKNTPNVTEMAIRQNRIMHLPSNCILIQRDGFEIPIDDSVAPIHDREGQASGVVIVFHDVGLDQDDGAANGAFGPSRFSGLPNRKLLNDQVRQAISSASRNAKKVAVLFLDLDGFKHINDSLGHPIGDRLLQSVAKRLAASVRRSDTVSRQGGDEFVVLLSEMEHSEGAVITMRRLLKALAEPHSIDSHDLHITACIGLSTYPDDGLDAETLIKMRTRRCSRPRKMGVRAFSFSSQP
jgi:diguanylate cyclase (GGDEF)-like protein/PAS domain S-box-containing protein